MAANFNASRLVAARQRVKMGKEALAKKINVTPKTLATYEAGDVMPGEDVVASLSATLGYPVEFFFGADINSPLPDNASFRSFSRMTAAQRASALSAGGFAFTFGEWIDANFNLPSLDVPDLTGFDAEAAAATIRSEWKLGVFPIRNMVHLLEAKGVRVFSLVEDTREVNAFCSWYCGKIPFIFLNTMKSSECSRFDAAHELGHILLHRHGSPKGKEIEAEANAFASALLMPKSEMLALAGRCRTIDDIMRIKKRWNVSAIDLVYRLHKVGVLTEWVYRSMCIELSSRGWRTKELDSAERETSAVLKIVFETEKSKKRGIREISQAVNLPVKELHKMVFGLMAVSSSGTHNESPQHSEPRRGHLTLVK